MTAGLGGPRRRQARTGSASLKTWLKRIGWTALVIVALVAIVDVRLPAPRRPVQDARAAFRRQLHHAADGRERRGHPDRPRPRPRLPLLPRPPRPGRGQAGARHRDAARPQPAGCAPAPGARLRPAAVPPARHVALSRRRRLAAPVRDQPSARAATRWSRSSSRSPPARSRRCAACATRCCSTRTRSSPPAPSSSTSPTTAARPTASRRRPSCCSAAASRRWSTSTAARCARSPPA